MGMRQKLPLEILQLQSRDSILFILLLSVSLSDNRAVPLKPSCIPFTLFLVGCATLYFISPLWVTGIWSGLPGNKSTGIIPSSSKPGYTLTYFAVSLTKQLCSQHKWQNTWKKHAVSSRYAYHYHIHTAKLPVWCMGSWSTNTRIILVAGLQPTHTYWSSHTVKA